MESNKKKLSLANMSSDIAVFIVFIMICIAWSILSPYFLTVGNIMNILMYSSVSGIAAVGMTLIIMSGSIDISVGSLVGFTGVCASLILQLTGNVFLAILTGIAAGTICGLLNGFLVTKAKIVPMIATLATMSIFKGVAQLVTDGKTISVTNRTFQIVGRGYLFDVVPVCAVILAVILIVFGYILKYTTFGRKIYAVGGNSEASRLAGINNERIKLVVYVLCGALAGLAGIMRVAQIGASMATVGDGLEMDAISAAVLGGTAITGGKGKLRGTLIGVLIMITLSNGLTLLNVQSFWQTIVKGVVLIVAIVFDVARGGGYKKTA